MSLYLDQLNKCQKCIHIQRSHCTLGAASATCIVVKQKAIYCHPPQTICYHPQTVDGLLVQRTCSSSTVLWSNLLYMHILLWSKLACITIIQQSKLILWNRPTADLIHQFSLYHLWDKIVDLLQRWVPGK